MGRRDKYEPSRLGFQRCTGYKFDTHLHYHPTQKSMKRIEQHENNRAVIGRITNIDRNRFWQSPSFESVIRLLNAEGYMSSRANMWTRRSLYRMLQREGYRGLHGLFRDLGAARQQQRADALAG
jgi:hypothetical protein